MSSSRSLRVEATALQTRASRLAALATDTGMRQQVTVTGRDLTEALDWLDRYGDSFDHRPSVIKIVEWLLGLTTARLDLVEDGLARYGNGARLVDVI